MNLRASPEELQKLKNVIDTMADVPEEEWAYFSGNLTARCFHKNQLLIHADEPVTDFFFINTGLVRFFYLKEEGKEFNKAFAMENDFVGSFSSMISDTPCRYSVQALEKTEVLVIPVHIIQNGYNRHPAWERIGRRHAERVAVKKEIREGEFLLDPAETRYRRLLSDYPTLTSRVHQYHLASYLGITDVALSRIRKKIGLT
jgi:CRP-like cAMP-binding protein